MRAVVLQNGLRSLETCMERLDLLGCQRGALLAENRVKTENMIGAFSVRRVDLFGRGRVTEGFLHASSRSPIRHCRWPDIFPSQGHHADWNVIFATKELIINTLTPLLPPEKQSEK